MRQLAQTFDDINSGKPVSMFFSNNSLDDIITSIGQASMYRHSTIGKGAYNSVSFWKFFGTCLMKVRKFKSELGIAPTISIPSVDIQGLGKHRDALSLDLSFLDGPFSKVVELRIIKTTCTSW